MNKNSEAKLTKVEMERYCGYYINEKNKFCCKIILKDDSLFWHWNKNNINKLTPLSNNTFNVDNDEKIITFSEVDGRITMTAKIGESITTYVSYDTPIPDEVILRYIYSSELRKKRKLQKIDVYDQPCITFVPLKDKDVDLSRNEIILSSEKEVSLPKSEEDIAFASVKELAQWIKSRELTSERLTRIYLDRLKKYGDNLNTVITITEDSALEQAKQADDEIANGNYRGFLHGIPYGLKDIIDTENIFTTWGLDYFKNRISKKDATVVKLLKNAGAILIAKLALGRCANGSSCHIGETKNPWNKSTSASGSSSGSGAATSAGLVAFALGTETWGSIEGPSVVCGVVGLRPSFGRVPRTGVLNGRYTWDKVGVLCRSTEDAAIVLSTINSFDEDDFGSQDINFFFNGEEKLENVKIGFNYEWFNSEDKDEESLLIPFTKNDFDNIIRKEYNCLDLSEFDLNFENMDNFSCEGSTVFDDFHAVANLKTENDTSYFKGMGFPIYSAVEYLHLQQLRTKLMKIARKMFEKVDCVVVPPAVDPICGIFNMTGHPSITIPAGLNEKGLPYGITLVGRMYDEGKLLRIAKDLEIKFNFSINKPQDYKIIE